MSIAEVADSFYGFVADGHAGTREAKNTSYAMDCGAKGDRYNVGDWWLRSVGDNHNELVAYVNYYGYVDNEGLTAHASAIGVRPVLHLNISSHVWREADSVRAEGMRVIWDCINFGNYWQNDTNGDGTADHNDSKEPIKWRVLSINENDAFLLADKNLDWQLYNEKRTGVFWETCTLRGWLNNNFFQSAFSDIEQSAIITTTVINADNPQYGIAGGNTTSDKVYLLSPDETVNSNYGFTSDYAHDETREAKNTVYAKDCGARTVWAAEHEGNGYWWLRSPGMYSNAAAKVSSVGNVEFEGSYADGRNPAVRPVLHLNLASDQWSKAGTVSALGSPSENESENNIPTAIPTAIPTPGSATSIPTPTITPNSIAKPMASTVNAPTKVKKVTAKNSGKKTVTLSWEKVTGAKGYQIQYALNKKFTKKKKAKFINKGKGKATIKKLKKKKTYYFRVRAYKLNGKKKIYGKWSSVKKVKIKR